MGSNIAAMKRGIDALDQASKQDASTNLVDDLHLSIPGVAKILADNEATLVAQGVLEGKSAAATLAEQRGLQEILSWFHSANIQVGRRDKRLTASIAVKTQALPEKKENF